jgi:hypothetical protein
MITRFLSLKPLFNLPHTRNLMMDNANQVNKSSGLTSHKAIYINNDSKSTYKNTNTNET